MQVTWDSVVIGNRMKTRWGIEIQITSEFRERSIYHIFSRDTGEWSQWTLTEPTICRRRCLPPNQTYYTDTNCFKPEVSKFKCDGLNVKLECGVAAESSKEPLIS